MSDVVGGYSRNYSVRQVQETPQAADSDQMNNLLSWTKQSRQDQQLKGCRNLHIQRILCHVHKFIFMPSETSFLWLCQLKKKMLAAVR